MEGKHAGFARRICTDASSKPLPIATVLSADFSSPWHKSDGQNCVAPAMERFSSGFWCGGRRNTRVFQGRQAGNHRKSPMSGGTDPFHVCPCFLPVLICPPVITKKLRYTAFSRCNAFLHHFPVLRFAAQPITAPSVYTTIKTNVAIKTNSTLERRSSVTFASMKQAAIVAA